MAYQKKKAAESERISKEVSIEVGNDIQLTGISIFPIKHDVLKGNVSITFNDCIVITGCMLREVKGNLYFGFPQTSYQKGKETVYNDIAFPIVKGARQIIADAVIDAYKDFN